MSGSDISNLLQDVHLGFPILFTGSGFSCGAKDKNGNHLKTGGQLSAFMNSEMAFKKDYPLDVVSREYKEANGEHKLFQLIEELFSATEISDEQVQILNLPWKRIYTTNYDNVAEDGLKKSNKAFDVVNAVNSQAAYLNKNKLSVIHLNGKIGGVDFRKFDEAIRLTRASYLTDSFMDSSWLPQFRADLTVATAIIIAGYSAYDIDIARILYSDPEFRQKTYFIETIDLDPVFQRELEQFGTVIKTPLNEFAAEISRYSIPPSRNNALISFAPVETLTGAREATGDDIMSLLLYGDFKPEVEIASRNGKRYYTTKTDLTDDALKRIQNGEKCFLVHSDLGNGKTIFLEKIAIKLRENRFNCFRLKSYDDYIEQDLINISKYERVVFLIEDFFRNVKIISKIRNVVPESAIIATTRSAIYELRAHRVEEIYGKNYIEYDLNKLSDKAVNELAELIDQNGLWSDFSKRKQADKIDFIKNKCQSEVRNVLIALFESPSIREKIIGTFNAQPDQEALKVLTTALLLDVGGFYPDAVLVNQFSGVDVFKSKDKINNAFSMEFIHNVRGSIRVKSSVFGEFVLQNVISADYIVDRLIELVKNCEKAKDSSSYFGDIQKEIIRFSFIDRVFKRKTAGDSYKRLYDSIKDLPSMARNPQFWLQYAIARLEDGNYRVSEIHFRTAYSHASRNPGYDTFQIDNHYARFLLESRTKDGSTKDEFKAFIDAHALLIKQAKKEKDAYYPYKVARLYYHFYKARGDSYNTDQLKVLKNSCSEMISEINQVPRSAQKYYVIEECYRDLNTMVSELNQRIISR